MPQVLQLLVTWYIVAEHATGPSVQWSMIQILQSLFTWYIAVEHDADPSWYVPAEHCSLLAGHPSITPLCRCRFQGIAYDIHS